MDDYKISFYVDEKIGKIVKIIIKNVFVISGGVLLRIEMINILIGNDVKFL